MNKKFLSAILFGALMVTSTGTFVSCKDYDDDIDEINGKIDKIETTLSELESKIGDKGVSSVTFDEKTGVLTVVDGTGSHTYTIKTTAPSVEKTVVTVDGKDLKVDGKVIGQLGDTVEVKDNELYVNGKATGIKVGKYAILENDADGMYTITLPDANGEMKTIKLPKATSGMMSVTANEATFTAKSIASTAPDGIAWGKAPGAITWKGAKGNIAKGQLLLGRYTEGEVTVVPSSYNLGAQTLKLVASDGSVAPVTVTATANNDLIYGERAASANGDWTVAITMDETVTADNIATAFATEVESQAKNVKYALSVNGDLVTGYEFVIDTDEDPEATALAATKIKVGGVNGTDDAKAESNPLTISNFKLGTNEIIIEDKDASDADAHKVYDAYLEIGDIDKAGRYGVTVNGMKITAADKAAKQEIPFIVHILDVTGTETKQYIKVTFVAATVEDEPIADQTYKLMPEKNFVIDLGNTFTGLTDEQADKVQGNITWATDGNFFKKDITKSNVTYYTDAACKKQVTDLSSAATIKTIKYAKIADSEIATAPKAGATKLTITLSDDAAAGNEIKKVSANYTITLPSFDELAVVNTNALWNEAGTTLTARMGYSSNATLSLAKAYTVKDGVKGLAIGDIEYVATYTTDAGKVKELTVNNGEIENAGGLIVEKKVKYNTLAATASIELATDLTVSKDFTVTVKSIFEDAKIVYYKAGAAQSIATVGADNYIAPLTGAADKRTGLALVFNGKEIAVAGTDMAIDGIKLTTSDPSDATEVKVEYKNTEASKGTVVAPTGTAASKDAKGVSITDMKSGEKGTLVVTFTDKNGVVTTSTIDYQYN
ncbi:S26 family signal peptidase [Phocaeicola massiliensis]|uniref:S26 family signal peptidase n=1 Tax=Phocaeicola massiliensis TaxID=204516 RepID=UPI00202FDA83|nr:S26 family signal peptidase [Phocaeicola massiliensis]MCM1615969.1 S26 family signal peptidase [Phocaeicola massiliensis]MCM1707704.1 S26 family signal peptidase [Phocaeicola massiliensis]